jgi:hypothetical protein
MNWMLLKVLVLLVQLTANKTINDSNIFFFMRLIIAANVRRYVQLAQSRGGACFCTRGAVQGYDVVLLILALAKTVTPGGSALRERGRPAGFCPAASAAKPGR